MYSYTYKHRLCYTMFVNIQTDSVAGAEHEKGDGGYSLLFTHSILSIYCLCIIKQTTIYRERLLILRRGCCNIYREEAIAETVQRFPPLCMMPFVLRAILYVYNSMRPSLTIYICTVKE